MALINIGAQIKVILGYLTEFKTNILGELPKIKCSANTYALS